MRRTLPPLARAIVVASLATGMLALAACAPEPGPVPTATRPSPTGSAAPSATPTPTVAAAELPDDCTEILPDAVAAQLAAVPLNPAEYPGTGVQSDGSLVCLWREPAADTSYLETTISRMNRGPALDLLNDLADTSGFSCYTPDGGTRCEKTWPNTQYPVTDGRTLYWRDDVLIDTKYSNLAPAGFTDGVASTIFTDG